MTAANTARPRTTRFAPSPTGALHLGNARTFLINWALARKHGWRIVLRIEDLDTPRTKPNADTQAIEDLAWLGMDWDEGPLYQAHDLRPYAQALAALNDHNLVYPCTCTRKQIVEALSAPQQGAHELRYPGTCRPDHATAITTTDTAPTTWHESDDQAWRVIVPDGDITFHDEVCGPQSCDVQVQVGDFVVASKAGLPAYQLAVVVDDARQGITDVVRGDDLLASTARQLLLYRLLGLTPPVAWWHLPLIVGSDGRRLAKRHGDTRIAAYREQGVPPERLIGLLAHWSGITDAPVPMPANEFASRFNLNTLPRKETTFSADQHQWLTA